MDFLAKSELLKKAGLGSKALSGILYQNDFTSHLDGISSYATLNLRREDNCLKFSATNAGRGLFVGPGYPQSGRHYTLVIKLKNKGLAGLKVYQNRADANSYVQTIDTTEEVSIPFVSAASDVDNRLFLSTSGPEYDIAIDYIYIYDSEAPQSGTGLWAGTYQQTVNNRLYTWIPSRDATIQPQVNGAVVLKTPVTKTSLSGGFACNRFIYDENYRRFNTTFLNDLLGNGAMLPDGHYHLLIHYFNATSYDQVDANPWLMAGNVATYQYYSAAPEAVSFSIETLGNESPPEKVKVPVTQERVSWVITSQYLTENLNLPAEKDYGVTRVHWDVVPNDKAANVSELLKKVSQIQVAGRSEFDSISPDRLWDCITGTGQTPSQIANGIRLSPRHSVMGQMKEQGLSNADLEKAFQLMYLRLRNDFGVTDPGQTRLYEDYFASTDGFGNGANFENDPTAYEEKKRQLSSVLEARKIYSVSNVNGNKPQSEYFLQNAYSYRNRGASGYLDSYQRIPNGIMLYRHIFEYEKTHLATNDRNVMCMSWAESEGVNSQPTRNGIKYRLKLQNGDLIRCQSVGLPFEMLKNQCFFALLLGKSFSLWNDSTNLVKNIDNWLPETKGGPVEYHENGQAYPVQWASNDPIHPQPVPSSILVSGRATMFPNAPQIGEQGAWVGAYLYGQISAVSDRVSESIQYASYSYRINNEAPRYGYQLGNEPVKGSLGNAEITRPGFVNAGQYNIVDLWEFQKPIVMVTKGAQGFSVIIKNVFCEPTDKVVYSVVVNGSIRDITHTGRTLGIYLF